MSKRIFFLLSWLALCLFSRAEGIALTGTMTTGDCRRLYLFTVYDEQNSYLLPLDSIELTQGTIRYRNDTLRSQLVFLSPVFNPNDMESTLQHGRYVFLSAGENRIHLAISNDGSLHLTMPGSVWQREYERFVQEKEVAGQRHTLDSLDQLFYSARDRGDQLAMQRIKTSSAPVYAQAYKQLRTWLDDRISAHGSTLFGLYLYYTYRLQHARLTSAEQINEARRQLSIYDSAARQSLYFLRAMQKVEAAERTLVGRPAPDITGIDPEGRPLSLKDFRGRYVLVDFWSSSCTWCRKETPNLLRAYTDFKTRGLAVLGVSTDFRRADWLKAIADDGALWAHLLLSKEARKEVLSAYSIISIPEILLVSPEGRIVAKGLRGKAIYEAVERVLGREGIKEELRSKGVKGS